MRSAVTLVAFLALLSSATASPTPKGRIKAFLQRQKVIRLFVTEAPGNGHQSASVNLIRELHAHGYRGAFELVYDDGTFRKVETLLPGFKSRGPMVQSFSFEGHQVTVMPSSHFHEQPPAKVAFGVTGAYDEGPGSEVEAYLKTAKDARVERLLKLQPRDWKQPHELLIGSNQRVSLEHLRPKGYAYLLPRVEGGKLREFLEHHMGDAMKRKVPALETIFKLVAKKNELLPVYGIGTNSRKQNRIQEALDDVQRVIQIGKGLALAHAQFGKRLRQGSVVPLFVPLDDGHLQRIRNAFPEGSNVTLVNASAADAAKQIERAAESGVALVYVGKVGKAVFEHAFANATLPATMEGKNSQDMMRALGKTHLNMVHASEMAAVKLKSKKAERILQAAVKELTDPKNTNYQALARFFVLSKRPTSVIRKTFAALQPKDPLAASKLFDGLQSVVDHIDGNGPNPETFDAPPRRTEPDPTSGTFGLLSGLGS
jgi:hypothetical protein